MANLPHRCILLLAKRNVKRPIDGMLDPNPDIRGYWKSLESNAGKVDTDLRSPLVPT
jgi:hypothetical protein